MKEWKNDIYSYVGFDVTEGRDVAWSDVSLEEVTYEERIRFNSEVELLRSVNCEYIIRYYDSWYDEKKNRIVIITQYMPSGTILEYIIIVWDNIEIYKEQRDINCSYKDMVFTNSSCSLLS